MRKSRWTGVAIAGIGALLLTASLREVFAESAPYVAGGMSSEQRFVSLETGTFAPANSRWSKNLFFLDCVNAAYDPFVLLERTNESRRTALSYCLYQANVVLAAEPSYALAWMSKAIAAAELGMFETMQSALTDAWRTAPNLNWMAEQRIKLVDRHYERATSPSVLANYKSDLGTLLTSYEGTDLLARLYVARPDRRDMLTEAVELADPNQQALFLSRVKSVATGSSS